MSSSGVFKLKYLSVSTSEFGSQEVDRGKTQRFVIIWIVIPADKVVGVSIGGKVVNTEVFSLDISKQLIGVDIHNIAMVEL